LAFLLVLPLTFTLASAEALLLHHAATIFTRLSKLTPGDLAVTIAIHAVKGRAPMLAFRNDSVAIGVHFIETSQRFFGTLTRYIFDFLAGNFPVAIGVHAHLRRITTLWQSELIKTYGAIVINIHLVDGLRQPLASLAVVTMTVGHSRHRNGTCHQKHH
jgi:hypothetical protein